MKSRSVGGKRGERGKREKMREGGSRSASSAWESVLRSSSSTPTSSLSSELPHFTEIFNLPAGDTSAWIAGPCGAFVNRVRASLGVTGGDEGVVRQLTEQWYLAAVHWDRVITECGGDNWRRYMSRLEFVQDQIIFAWKNGVLAEKFLPRGYSAWNAYKYIAASRPAN